MKILLVQLDGKMPNLALMKLSAYHRARGDIVGLHVSDPDRVYVSCVFSSNREQAEGIKTMYPHVEVIIGGSGYDLQKKLPEDIEYLKPDYSLYDIDYSMGFTSRGCPKCCPFCIVHEKEGNIRHHRYVWEIMEKDHKKVILLDNNFLASPHWVENISYINQNKIMVNFNQGLDLQYVTKGIARTLKNTRYYNWHFNRKQLHFAWDLMENERYVRRGLEFLIDEGITKSDIMVYVLIGFNTSFEDDYYRYKILWEEYGIYPFIMIYNNQGTPLNHHFARWVNRRIHKSCPFEMYERLSRSEKQKVVGVIA